MFSDELNLLKSLTAWHSTPGDESDFLDYLSSQISPDFWESKKCGFYGIVFANKQIISNAPTILLTAHADSPGFIVQSIDKASQTAKAVSIGHPHVDEKSEVKVKKSSGKMLSTWIYPETEKSYPIDFIQGLERGDRLCFAPFFSMDGDTLKGTFLDNRIGCFLLVKLAKTLSESRFPLPANIILAITTGEEFTGFGASVIAHKTHPDFIICLDATYEDSEQEVLIGGGPVVTLTDKSILLPAPLRQSLKGICALHGIPLQEEIYNFSGTDARAFPASGLSAPVLPLLIATIGNHSPCEACSLQDIDFMHTLLLHLCRDDFSLFTT